MSRKALVILGSQWGDEGKGKIVDLLAENTDLVCRTGGGANAGTSGPHGRIPLSAFVGDLVRTISSRSDRAM